MKTIDINAMTENVILKQNLLVKRISNGEDLNVFPKNGSVTVIRIVLMVLTRIQPFIVAQHHSHVLMINLHAVMEDASIKDGFVTVSNPYMLKIIKTRHEADHASWAYSHIRRVPNCGGLWGVPNR